MADRFNLAQFLSQQYLCESLTMRQVQTLIDYTELVGYSRSEVITDIGDVGEALYFVVGGEAALRRMAARWRWGAWWRAS